MGETVESESKMAENETKQKVPWREWSVILGGILIEIPSGLQHSAGNMVPYVASFLRAKVNPSITAPSLIWVNTAALIAEGLCGFLMGLFERKFGPRTTALLGALIQSLSYILTYFILQASLPYMAVIMTYGALTGVAISAYYFTPVQCAMGWFPGREGLAAGLVTSGIGVGAMIFIPLQSEFINPENLPADEDGYYSNPELLQRVESAFLLMAAVSFGLQLLGWCFIRAAPVRYAVNPNIQTQKSVIPKSKLQMTKVIGYRNSLCNTPRFAFPQMTAAVVNIFDFPGNDSTTGSTDTLVSSKSSGSYDAHSTAQGPFVVGDKNQVAVECDTGYDQIVQTKPIDSNGDAIACGLPPQPVFVPEPQTQNLGPLEVIQTREFKILYTIHICHLLFYYILASLFKTFGQTFMNDQRFMANVFIIGLMCNSLGRICWGFIYVRIGFRKCSMIAFSILSLLAFTLILTKEGGKPMFAAWMFALQFCLAAIFVFVAAVGRQQFGQMHVFQNYCLVRSSMIPAGLLSAVCGQILVESMGYFFVFALCGSLLLMCVPLCHFFREKHKYH